MPEKLFEEFPPISTEQWEEQIRIDLNGADYGETLLWRTPDGLTARPYYRAEDMKRLAHLRAESFVEMPRSWLIRQDVLVSDLESGRRHVRLALEGGAESIGLRFADNTAALSHLEVLAMEVASSDSDLHIDAGAKSADLLDALIRTLDRSSVPGRPRFTAAFDPLGEAARTKVSSPALLNRAADTVINSGEDVRPLSIDSQVYHDAGATLVQETALILASFSEYLVQLIERGIRAADILRRLFVVVHIAPSFLPEVARLRALRLLLPQVAAAFVPGQIIHPLPIQAHTSLRERTADEPHMNLVRAATEACAAVIGGCDVLVVQPVHAGEADAFAYRLARNVQLILRHESNLDKVSDPSAGSYYIESFTDAFARRAWQLFQEVEAHGGLLRSIESGFLSSMLNDNG